MDYRFESISAFTLYVNYKKVKVTKTELRRNLSEFLREHLELRGTKIACGEGGCGACTVIVSKKDQFGRLRHVAVNACVTPLWSLHNCHVLSIEGIADGKRTCHALQDSIARNNGTQCGFCTPGMVMSAYALLFRNEGLDSRDEVESLKSALEGNLCRCTGYRPILDALKNYKLMCGDGKDIEDLCISEKPFSTPDLEDRRVVTSDHKQNAIKIEELLSETESESEISQNFVGTAMSCSRPTTLDEAFNILRANPAMKIAGGYTELYSSEKESDDPEKFLLLDGIPELKSFGVNNSPESGFIKLGAGLTISEMVEFMELQIRELPAWRTRGLRAIVKLMARYGSAQIRNAATIGGSLMCTNPGSDVQTFYSPLNCWAIRYDCETQNVYSRKAKIPFRGRSIITKLEIPFTDGNEFVWMEKVTSRKFVDVSILNAAARMTMDSGHEFVERVIIGFGGIAVNRFELDLVFEKETLKLDQSFLDCITQSLLTELPRYYRENNQYSQSYLVTVGKNLMQKFYETMVAQVKMEAPVQPVCTHRSSQLFPPVENVPNAGDIVGKPIVHASAFKHATGEARYCDDVPPLEGELFMALVLSGRAHAEILSVDPSEALKIQGVVGYVCHEDAPKNTFGMVIQDEEIFASTKVTCHGQIIGGIVATERSIAHRAVKLVKIEYRDIEPRILTIDDAVKHSSFYTEQGMKLQRLVKFAAPFDHVIEGHMNVGSQAHFYMEPQACIVIPKGEDDEYEVISSTQNPMDVQRKIAEALNIPSNRVVAKVKRIGGGFGGKESRCMLVALPAAVAAHKFGKPVRCVLDRETDMRVSGKRHAFQTTYTVGFSNQGKIQSLRMKIYCNGGNTLDISEAAIERVIVNMDNAYNILHFDLEGFICKTNTASNTVFRGTGGPQAAMLIENILDRVSTYLKLDPVEVRRSNMYRDGHTTPYGQTLSNSMVEKCWSECLAMSNYYERKKAIDIFNSQSKYVKRGISMNPCHYGVAYTAVFLNQGAALVHIYTDGSVLITHNGVEIGQGLHTKMIQVATRELGIPAAKIRISDTSTDKVPNGTPTSASSGSDLIGMAVLNACHELIKRLQPYLEAQKTWEGAVSAAYFDRVSLSATGFYKTPRIGWDKNRHGEGFNYFSCGAACTEVELDCLTGQHTIIRTDIVMDVGKSLNPAIDIGQIEGAFVQGTGFFTTEELLFDPDGKLISVGPNSYKIPTFSSAPQEFNVSILSGSSNPHAIYSSKAIGEPPILLATSSFYAIKECVRAFRVAENKSADFRFDCPASVQRILSALAGDD